MGHTNSLPISSDRFVTAEARLPAHLTGDWQRIVRIIWFILAALAVIFLVASIPGALLLAKEGFTPRQTEPRTDLDQVTSALSALLSLSAAFIHLALAGLLFHQKPRERMAMFVSFYLLIHGTVNTGPLELIELSLTGSADFVQRVIQPAISTAIIVSLLSLFPDGRFVPRWTRWLSLFAIFTIPLPFVMDIFALPESSLLFTGFVVVVAGTIYLAALYAQIYRYRHVSDPVAKQQTKWVVFGFGLMVLFMLISSIPYSYYLSRPSDTSLPWWYFVTVLVFWWPAMYMLPVTLSVAILRYRLWDIDILINRTLVYTALTIIIVGLYVMIVGSLSTLLQTGGHLFVSLFATGIVAMLFQPLRAWLQQRVNRLMYGERDNPYQVLTHLSKQLEATLAHEAVLPTIVESIAQALKLPYAAITLKQGLDFVVASEFGLAPLQKNNRENMLILPLIHNGQSIGQLRLAPRGPNDPFTPPDIHLLEDMAHQVSIAAHTVRLTTDLQRSRERLVTTREEERRRLRRDLHDELGPVLASIAFKLDATDNFIEQSPAAAHELVGDIKAQIQTALADIRRIAYNLRPPALDELGLIGALKEYVDTYSHGNRLKISVDAPENMPPLAAAVEVAAYHIVREAITNMIRHAEAQQCHVHISLNSQFCLEITDNGHGLPDEYRAGVGLNSMRERASELGGTFTIESGSGGTRLTAQLPLLQDRTTRR